MKKVIIALIGCFSIMCFAGSVYAAEFNNGAGGALVTCVASDANYDNLTFNPSPGCLIQGWTTTDNFTLGAVNLKATKDAMAYVVVSQTNRVYQDAIEVTKDTVAIEGLTLDDATCGSAPTGGSWMTKD